MPKDIPDFTMDKSIKDIIIKNNDSLSDNSDDELIKDIPFTVLLLNKLNEDSISFISIFYVKRSLALI